MFLVNEQSCAVGSLVVLLMLQPRGSSAISSEFQAGSGPRFLSFRWTVTFCFSLSTIRN